MLCSLAALDNRPSLTEACKEAGAKHLVHAFKMKLLLCQARPETYNLGEHSYQPGRGI